MHKENEVLITFCLSLKIPGDLYSSWSLYNNPFFNQTTTVGAELVQAGRAVYGRVEVEQIEDSLITGQ